MKNIFRTTALFAALVTGGAHAQVYVEGSLVPTKITAENSDVSYKPSILTGIVGYDLHPNLAIEGLLGFGVKKGSFDGWDVKVKSTYGVYLKPRYQVNDKVEVFARIGDLKNRFEGSDSTESDRSTEGSTAWGLGGSYAIDKNLYLTAGYNQLYKKDGVKATGFNFGVGYKF